MREVTPTVSHLEIRINRWAKRWITQQQRAATRPPERESGECTSQGQLVPSRCWTRERGSLALILEHVLGGVQSVSRAVWKLSSGSITGLWFSKDAILPGGRQATGYCSVTECKAVLRSCSRADLGWEWHKWLGRGCHSKLTGLLQICEFFGGHGQLVASRGSPPPQSCLNVKTRVSPSHHLWPRTLRSSAASLTSSINSVFI